MEDLENENDDQENSRDSKSDSDDFDKDFDDIKIDVSGELKHIGKIHVSEASFHQKEPSFTLTIVFKSSKEADEKSKSVCRKYSEFQWLDSQLQKSFPGGLIPSLPSIYDVTNPFSTKIIREVDSSETIKDLSYTYNDHITLSNYVAQILGNERFRNGMKLKEFITNEEIKMFANMDNDDPLLHNRIFKFFKSTGKSLLNYAWSTENQDLQNSNDLKGNSISIHDEKSPQEISKLLKVAKLGIDSQVLILTELCTNIFNLIKSVGVLNTRDYKQLDEDQGAKGSLHSIHNNMCTAGKLVKLDINELVSHLKVKVLINSRKLLAKYKNVVRAIDRLLVLSNDVGDLDSTISKYKNDFETQEMYKSEYDHCLKQLRINFIYLIEDTKKCTKKEEKNLKKIIEEFYQAQRMYVMMLNSEGTEIINI